MSIDERASTHVYRQKQLFTKEELEARESLCIHEELAYCDAECPLKLDVKAILAAVAAEPGGENMWKAKKVNQKPLI